MLSIKEEDYLRAIFLHENNGTKSIDIARELKISKASVSEMLKKLAKRKLITLKPYSRVYLTEKGESLASEIFRKHRVAREFMKNILKSENQDALKQAHNLEHAFSLENIEKLEKIMKGKRVIAPTYIG